MNTHQHQLELMGTHKKPVEVMSAGNYQMSTSDNSRVVMSMASLGCGRSSALMSAYGAIAPNS